MAKTAYLPLFWALWRRYQAALCLTHNSMSGIWGLEDN
jgi:hypothetical protein